MNKREMAEQLYKKVNVKRFEAYHFIDLLIEVVVENLSQDNKIVLSNFGTFKVIQRQAKKVINPNDEREMIIPPRRLVKFFPSRNLKELIDKG